MTTHIYMFCRCLLKIRICIYCVWTRCHYNDPFKPYYNHIWIRKSLYPMPIIDSKIQNCLGIAYCNYNKYSIIWEKKIYIKLLYTTTTNQPRRGRINFFANVISVHPFFYVRPFGWHSGVESRCPSDMAEGIEEAESNSSTVVVAGDAKTSMLGAAIPCDIITTSAIGSLKRDFNTYHHGTIGSAKTSASPTAVAALSMSSPASSVPSSPAPISPAQMADNNNSKEQILHHSHSGHHLPQHHHDLNSEVSIKLNPYACDFPKIQL